MIYDLDFALRQVRKWLNAVEVSAKLGPVPTKVLSEAEYKEYLAEQDRLQREAEEQQ